MGEDEQKFFVETISYNASVSSFDDESTPLGITEEDDPIDIKDREVNIILSRDDDGCKAAYENCVDVSNSVDRKVSLYNPGIVVNSKDKEKFKEQIQHLEKKKIELQLDTVLTSALTNRELWSYAAIGMLRKNSNGEILQLTSIRTLDGGVGYRFIPIINSITSKLGVKGLDPNNLGDVVTAIQIATPSIYDHRGNRTQGDEKITYYTDNSIMILGIGSIDAYSKGISPVRRVLRYTEGLMRLENTVLLLARRPTQLIYTAGNKDHNLLNAEIPKSYLEDANQDRVTAKLAYKTARLAALGLEAKKLTAGNVLAQVLEYGTSVAAIEVPEGLPYVDYMHYMERKIKMGILSMETTSQRVVRSRLQEANFASELVEKAEQEHKKILGWLNNSLTSILLEGTGATIHDVWYEFEEIKRENKEEIARFWFHLSKAADFFTKAGVEFPDEFVNLMDMAGMEVESIKRKDNAEIRREGRRPRSEEDNSRPSEQDG